MIDTMSMKKIELEKLHRMYILSVEIDGLILEKNKNYYSNKE